jgi:hypothetical protein
MDFSAWSLNFRLIPAKLQLPSIPVKKQATKEEANWELSV